MKRNIQRKRKPGQSNHVTKITLLILLLLFSLSACGSQNQTEAASEEAASAYTETGSGMESSSQKPSPERLADDPDISPSLVFESILPLDYAQCFRIFLYQDGYALISICDGTRYLLVPDKEEVPDGLDSGITVLQQPVKSVYLAGSACMDMFVKTGALDCISLSGTQADKWYIGEASEAMKSGAILYAGKYNAPDYELILSKGCDLAIENTMILHTPEVREQLIKTGIPVLIDHSSYESHPLGRTEWVKLYGVLTGHRQEAEQAFGQQKKACETIFSSNEKSGRSMAFFSITSAGTVTIRKSTDYVPAMIRLAGGSYLPDDSADGSITSTTSIQMEDFCRRARDADCLVYNSTIEGPVPSIEELLRKAPALKTFPAIKQGHVWCASRNLYQDSMETGTIISDFQKILSDPDSSSNDLHYLYKLT